jgi:hypothetical protein
MTDRGDAEILQIIRGQLGQESLGDVILAEGGGVRQQPQALQPVSDVHAALRSLSRCGARNS